ncbi:hypothetical protein R1flu_004170 [Riccia fluitans]|uniref:Reverse transcriptase domain-containing protein n=1 Tax=Riccia fluitans TaxID=41844 RepID=A0ABD1YQ21_9MARC
MSMAGSSSSEGEVPTRVEPDGEARETPQAQAEEGTGSKGALPDIGEEPGDDTLLENGLPDLSREQIIEMNRLEKQKREKKEQKREAKRKKADRIRADRLTHMGEENATRVWSDFNSEDETLVREATELLECSILWRRCRATWAEKGKTCSRYFFATLKDKQSQEKMSCLWDEEGTLVQDKELILQRVHKYYKELYSQPAITLAEQREQDRTLNLIDQRVSEEDNARLMALPGADELKDAVKELPANKAPGEDGLTAEVLHEMWEEVSPGCLKFVQEVWQNKRIGQCNFEAIIKLIPKNDKKEELKNWCPISLLTLAYKLAFIRVQHTFLWATMRRMGFTSSIIELTRSLVSEGHAKVHLNGRLTNTFKLERGVRQGCPISPLLFALSTQPLMRLLREGERRGDLVGVNIPRGRTSLHRLFADDSGVAIQAEESNFRSLCQIIERFEKVSGPQLNPAKSVIVPFTLGSPPS